MMQSRLKLGSAVKWGWEMMRSLFLVFLPIFPPTYTI